MRRGKPWLIVALALTAGGTPGCVALKPYERAELMSRIMREPLNAREAAFDAHVHRTREAVAGATIAKGVSCGCD